jgi:hypothetical protein
MATVAQNYQTLSYKGIEFPATMIDVGFSQELGEHKFLFKDEQFFDPQGRTNLTWRIETPLSQNNPRIRDLYVSVFPQLFEACLDREPGDFVTPDIGTHRVVCASFSYQITPQQLDGTTPTIQFVRAPTREDFEQPFEIKPSVTQAESFADLIDNEIDQYDSWLDDEKPPSLKDPLTAITHLSEGILFEHDAIIARMNGAAARARDAERAVENLLKTGREDVSSVWATIAKTRKLQLDLKRAARLLGGAQNRIYKKYLLNERSIDDLVSDTQCKFETLMRLNPGISQTPIVPEGSTIRFIPNQ